MINDELKLKIDQLMQAGEYEAALPLIESELEQLYLPPGFLEDYLAYQAEIKAALYPKAAIPTHKLFEMLLDHDHALVALHQLQDVALMNYHDEIEEFLLESQDDFIKGLLIELMIAQNLKGSFKMIKDDQDLEFMPMYIQSVYDNESFHQILKRFVALFEAHNPSVLNLCEELLISESISLLPFSLEADDENPLAFAIIKAVLIALNDEDMWYDIQAQYEAESRILMPLRTFSTL